MKKEYQLISIAGLGVLTVALLVLIFVRQYNGDGSIVLYYKDVIEIFYAEKNELPLEEIPETEVEEEQVEELVEKPLEFVASDKSYFDDALFIGDSRCVGIKEYGKLDNATFFVMEGMSVHNLWEKEISIDEKEKVTLQEVLDAQSYSKIYVMLGFNELGYDLDYSANKYKETLDALHVAEPNAIIYVCSNLHVTEKLSSSDATFNNERINLYNEKLRALTDHETFFYLEVNEKFDDENGNLMAECSGDETHLYAKYYQEWAEWFCEKTIQK